MPSVNVAMERSLRGGFLDLLTASLRPVFERRDAITNVQGQISDVKTAFSSWDNCMQAVYCKWPVIAIIIVGGLIIFSVIWCVSRCLCCGLSCCCECCYCLKCCGNCCGCCDPPRGRRHKYLDEPFVPPHHGAYKAHEPMVAGPTPPFGGPTSPFSRPAGGVAEPPQYAEFDVSKKGGAGAAGAHEDALPVMPTWDSAGSKKILVEEDEEAVEMNQLKKPEASTPGLSIATGSVASASTNGQNVPLLTGASALPGPVSPIPSPDHRTSPYSPPPGGAAANSYMNGAASAADPYGGGYNGYGGGHGAYGQSQASLGADAGYGMAGAAMAGGAGRRPPRDYNNNNNTGAGYGQELPAAAAAQDPYRDAYGHDQGYPAAAAGYNGYGSGAASGRPYDDYNSPSNSAGYGRGGMRSPPRSGGGAAAGYPQERMGRSPPPRAAEYGMGGARTYSPAPMAPPQRQPTYEMPVPQQQQQQSQSQRQQPSYEMPVPQQQPEPQRQPSFEMPAEPVAVVGGGHGNGGNDNSGFDFGSGYGSSRPQQQQQQQQRQQRQGTPGRDYNRGAARDDGYGGAGGRSGRRPPPQQQGGQGGYSGYRGYNAGGQQQQQGWSGI